MGLDRQKLSYLKFGDVIKIKKKKVQKEGGYVRYPLQRPTQLLIIIIIIIIITDRSIKFCLSFIDNTTIRPVTTIPTKSISISKQNLSFAFSL
jgi:hypothetical protein